MISNQHLTKSTFKEIVYIYICFGTFLLNLYWITMDLNGVYHPNSCLIFEQLRHSFSPIKISILHPFQQLLLPFIYFLLASTICTCNTRNNSYLYCQIVYILCLSISTKSRFHSLVTSPDLSHLPAKLI